MTTTSQNVKLEIDGRSSRGPKVTIGALMRDQYPEGFGRGSWPS